MRHFCVTILVFSLITLFLSTNCFAALQDAQADSLSKSSRKKVGLVLSGGGAKGVAHIGVLKVLEEAGIPIDYIAGTSMGSIVGALYAVGYNSQELDMIVNSQDWMSLFGNHVGRDDLLYTQKEISDNCLVSLPFNGKKFVVSNGLLNGNAVLNLFTQLTTGYHHMDSFEQLPVPFVCVAYDITTGDEVDMKNGSLPLAMRSSMSIPGAFTPVSLDEALLIDGGVINNFPVDLVKEMGADIVIGVDVSMITDNRTSMDNSQATPEEKSRLSYATKFLTGRLGKAKFLDNLEMTDLYIHPYTADYSAASFSSVAIDTLLLRGETQARAQWDEIMEFKKMIGLTPQAEEEVAKEYQLRDACSPQLDSIAVGAISYEGLGNLNLGNLKRIVKLPEYEKVSTKEFFASIARMKGTGFFSSITYDTERNGDYYDIIFHLVRQYSSMVSFGARIDNQDIMSMYGIFQYSPEWLNGITGEMKWRINFDPYISLGVFYQTGWLGKFGVSYKYRHSDLYLYNRFDENITENFFHHQTVRLDLANIYLRNWNFYLDARYEWYKPQEVQFEQSNFFNNQKDNLVIYNGGLKFNNFDDTYFPSKGVDFHIDYSYYTDDFKGYKGAEAFRTMEAGITAVIPIGKHFAFIPELYGRTIVGEQCAFLYHNYFGGPLSNIYFDHQHYFYGLKPTMAAQNHLAIAMLKARLKIKNNHYLWVQGNIAKTSNDLSQVYNWTKDNLITGMAIGYSYHSIVGPITISYDFGNSGGYQTGIFVSIGKYF